MGRYETGLRGRGLEPSGVAANQHRVEPDTPTPPPGDALAAPGRQVIEQVIE